MRYFDEENYLLEKSGACEEALDYISELRECLEFLRDTEIASNGMILELIEFYKEIEDVKEEMDRKLAKIADNNLNSLNADFENTRI